MTGPNDRGRLQAMLSLYRDGNSFSDIARIYGRTPQAIQMYMSKHIEDLDNGGFSKVMKQRRFDRKMLALKKKDEVSHKYYGVPSGFLEAIPSSARKKYIHQKKNADTRGIDWLFNLQTWWKVWDESGKWEKRGRSTGCYVMGRKGDTGPYSPENVYIITCTENIKEVRDRERFLKGKI